VEIKKSSCSTVAAPLDMSGDRDVGFEEEPLGPQIPPSDDIVMENVPRTPDPASDSGWESADSLEGRLKDAERGIEDLFWAPHVPRELTGVTTGRHACQLGISPSSHRIASPQHVINCVHGQPMKLFGE
jgi:hypothetical protein